jgi:hypothetical protein
MQQNNKMSKYLYRINTEIKEIEKTIAIEFVQERHYSKVMPKLTKHWLGIF